MPGLARYQALLAAAVCGEPLAPEAREALGPISARGIAMTARVRRSWCRGRAARAAPLTLSALPPPEREALLSAWVERGGGTHSFFEAEAAALLDFLAEGLEDPSHALALCRFERAVVHARATPFAAGPSQVRLAKDALLYRSPDAALVPLTAPIEALLGAIDGRAPWPRIDAWRGFLLVAPGIEGLAREATEPEIRLWRAAERGLRADEEVQTARNMLACGALRIGR